MRDYQFEDFDGHLEDVRDEEGPVLESLLHLRNEFGQGQAFLFDPEMQDPYMDNTTELLFKDGVVVKVFESGNEKVTLRRHAVNGVTYYSQELEQPMVGGIPLHYFFAQDQQEGFTKLLN